MITAPPPESPPQLIHHKSHVNVQLSLEHSRDTQNMQYDVLHSKDAGPQYSLRRADAKRHLSMRECGH